MGVVVTGGSVYEPEGTGGGGGDAPTLGGQAPAFYLDRPNHTGVQAIATVTGLQTALDSKESTANKATSLTSPDNTKYPTTLAVATALAGVGGGAGMGKQVGAYISGRSYRTALLVTTGESNFSSAANGVYLAPFIPAVDMPINAIGIFLQASASVRFSIYDASANGSPVNLLFDSAITVATGGVVNYSTVNMTLQKGKVYWLQLRTLTSVLLQNINQGLICEMHGVISGVYQNGITTTQTFANASPAVFPLDLAAMPDANRTAVNQTPIFLLRAA